MCKDYYESIRNEASTEIRWLKGIGMWDSVTKTIPNYRITPTERTILEKCHNNKLVTKNYIPFLLLRLNYDKYQTFDIYKAT